MDKTFSSQEDSEIHKLLETLSSEHGMERQKAREALVAKGKSVIDFLMELLSHPKYIFRWEAAKTLEEIGDPLAIPLFIRTLEDEKSDVRWIAAKGLIKLGELSVKPLLKALIENSGSIFILEGAHHVFFDLSEENKLPDNFPIDKFLAAFKHPSPSENIKSLAYEILNNRQPISAID